MVLRPVWMQLHELGGLQLHEDSISNTVAAGSRRPGKYSLGEVRRTCIYSELSSATVLFGLVRKESRRPWIRFCLPVAGYTNRLLNARLAQVEFCTCQCIFYNYTAEISFDDEFGEKIRNAVLGAKNASEFRLVGKVNEKNTMNRYSATVKNIQDRYVYRTIDFWSGKPERDTCCHITCA